MIYEHIWRFEVEFKPSLPQGNLKKYIVFLQMGPAV